MDVNLAAGDFWALRTSQMVPGSRRRACRPCPSCKWESHRGDEPKQYDGARRPPDLKRRFQNFQVVP